ncbi:hypothetical protein IW152_005684 [Coemansia sp. BCRC 34962]|nr:hypothetical protein IW152_005684 [Coemansia sp. BCRC 34962]
MQRSVVHSSLPRSAYGRMRVISRQQWRRLPVAQSIASGMEESKRIKTAAKRKVAWQQASTMFETYSRFLELAIYRQSPIRLHLVLRRMVGEHLRLGKPTGVSFELLDRCALEILTWVLDNGSNRGRLLDSALGAVECLDEISWRVRHQSCTITALWALSSAVASDLRGDAANCTRALAGLSLEPRDIPLVSRVLKSSVLSMRFLSDLYSRVDIELGIDFALATAFYISVIANRQFHEIPETISASMLAHGGSVSMILGESNAKSTVLANSALALAHLHICRADVSSTELVLEKFDQLTVPAKWPMGALAIAIRRLLDLQQKESASRFLEVSAAKSYHEFRRLVGEQSALDSSEFKLALLEDELDITLCAHRDAANAQAIACPPTPGLPRAAFFAPKLRIRFSDHGVAECIKRYYANMDQLLRHCFPTPLLARQLIREAGSWNYRLQSPVPVLRLTSSLCQATWSSDKEGVQAPELLLEFTRLLCNAAMLRLTDQTCSTKPASSQYTCSSLLTQTDSVSQVATYQDPLTRFELTRRAILSEYLRHGVEPPAEALAIFHSHLAASHCPEASRLALRILPKIPPSLVGQRYAGNLAVQAYYESLLLSCQRQPRRLLQLFVHLMGHHGAASSPEFLRRIVDLAVVAYLRHRYFRGMGFFRLERVLVRCVDRPRFSIEYLNHMRARFWALHMFLRRRKYVPRFKLYKWQFRAHNQLYKLQVTAIPSAAKIKAQRISTRIESKVSPRDIDAAVNIFQQSVPRSLPNTERSSLGWMIEHQTHMVTCQERGI